MSENLNSDMNPELKKYIPFVKAIARMFGEHCEVLLHDAGNLEHSIAMIENGHVTGRKIGSPMTDLGLYFLQSDLFSETEFVANYQTESKDGKKLKSTSIFLRNEKGEIIGFLCMNYDISHYSEMGKWINDFCQINSNFESESEEEKEETFTDTLDDLFDRVFSQTLKKVAVPVEKMQKEDKMQIVRILHKRGVFLVNGTIDEVASRLNVSRYTVYNYLAEIKKDKKKKVI